MRTGKLRMRPFMMTASSGRELAQCTLFLFQEKHACKKRAAPSRDSETPCTTGFARCGRVAAAWQVHQDRANWSIVDLARQWPAQQRRDHVRRAPNRRGQHVLALVRAGA